MKTNLRSFLVVFLYLSLGVPCLAETYQASYMPWSGYWWPMRSGALVNGDGYRGRPSPLSKYDYATTGDNYGSAYFYGLKNFYDPDALSWEGLCFSWAVASILEEEPDSPGVYGGIKFFVGDKKGLLTAAYHKTVYNTYPVNEPEEFHKVLYDFIQDQEIPIIVDLHTDGEIWNYPVYRFDSSYTQSGDERHYTTRIYYPRNGVDPDYVGTFEASTTYYYYFRVDNAGEIVESGWEGDSIDNPPNRAFEPFGIHQNPSDVDYDTVKLIVGSNDDDFEENDSLEEASEISSGAYQLFANDFDYYKIPLRTGDSVDLILDCNSLEEDISLKIFDPDGLLIMEYLGQAEGNFSANSTGDYILEIEPFSEWMDYDLTLSISLPLKSIFPVNMNGSWSNGIALLADGEEGLGRILISLIEKSGSPLNSCFADSQEKHLLGTLEGTFGLVSTANGYIRVDSDLPVRGLEAVSNGATYLMGSNVQDQPSDSYYFPYLGASHGYTTSIGLINGGEESEIVERNTFDSDGALVATDEVELDPGQKIEDTTSSILKSSVRGVSVNVQSGRNSLYGYLKIEDSGFSASAEALVSIAASGATRLVVPHVANTDAWWTIVAIINAGGSIANLTVSAYDQNGNIAGTYESDLNPGQSLIGKVSDFFPLSPLGEIVALKIENAVSNMPLSGYMLFGSEEKTKLAGIPLFDWFESPIYLPHMASSNMWHTGVGVMNGGQVAGELKFSLYDASGNILRERTATLNPNQRLGSTAAGLFGLNFTSKARYMKVESLDETPVSGIYIIGTMDNSRLMGDVMR